MLAILRVERLAHRCDHDVACHIQQEAQAAHQLCGRVQGDARSRCAILRCGGITTTRCEAPDVLWQPPPSARATAARRGTVDGAAPQLVHAQSAEPPSWVDRAGAHARAHARGRWRSSAGGTPHAPRCTWGTSASPLRGDRNYGSSAAFSVAGTSPSRDLAASS